MFFLLLALASIVSLVTAAVFFVIGQHRRGGRILIRWAAGLAAYATILVTVAVTMRPSKLSFKIGCLFVTTICVGASRTSIRQLPHRARSLTGSGFGSSARQTMDKEARKGQRYTSPTKTTAVFFPYTILLQSLSMLPYHLGTR